MAADDPRTTILVLHPDSLDPKPYLHRLIAQPDSANSSGLREHEHLDIERSGESSKTIPWTIDNKYYSAEVTVHCHAQEEVEQALAEDVEVVVYLFAGQLRSLPPALVRVMAEPRDIALAVRIPYPTIEDTPGTDAPTNGVASQQAAEADETGDVDLHDVFDELGMEFLDETSPLTEEDDERPVPILEQVRQTLMTHMWPNMIRKPLSISTKGIDEDLLVSPSSSSSSAADRPMQDASSAFPTSFDPANNLGDEAGPSTMPALTTAAEGPNEFPGVDELRSQIMLEDTERLGEFSRLDMLDQDDDWVQAEYSRLDDWLEGDDEAPDDTLEQSVHSATPDREPKNEKSSSPMDETPFEGGNGEESQFEDDFADFAPFQSALPPATASSSQAQNLPLDPTPLLLHLQNVREELAGLDEDTRRKRAGKEVETVLRSLGLGGLDWEEDDLADLEDTTGRS